MKTVWIVKYALTRGIYEAKVITFRGTAVTVEAVGYFNNRQSFAGKDWSYTKEGAVKVAEGMRGRKIDSLKKQIQRLEELEFNA